MQQPKLKEVLRRLGLGIIIWIIPFIGSFFVWDKVKNAPSISYPWFYALMTFLGAISLAIAVYYFFKVKQPKECVIGTGFLWYIECLALDAIFLMGLFKMSWNDYNHLFLTYTIIPIMMILISKIKK